ncbi:YdcF family protein [Flammeovirgaceae bacterium SG7u.111]|nr:YdcF family protein [Flammeovirgaceae bacterium SG7u.132]WPO33556.1 YdcF family protein [Flammeovirgaceae bacterium SG7u.111]
MFYVLSKTIYLVAMPLSWVFILLIFALFTKKKNRRKAALICSILVLYFGSNTYFATKLVDWWEIPAVPLKELNSPYDVGIVLGGMSEGFRKPADRVYTKRGADRLIQAAHLWKNGLVEKLMVTGGYYHFTSSVSGSEAQAMGDLLRQWGVPDSVIIMEHISKNTRENATMCKAMLDSLGYNASTNYVLITSAFHMRRSDACFEKVGIDADVFSTDFLAMKYFWNWWFLFECDASNLHNVTKIIHEMVGMAAYKVTGYI